ncbi:MAG: 16S rRNA (uracil(1498)-N(3))-methyltransferase [Pseudomonadota bacterium]
MIGRPADWTAPTVSLTVEPLRHPMRIPRVLVQGPINGRESLDLEEPIAHHIQRVLRLRPGEPLVLFDGRGGEYQATLVQRSGRLAADIHQHREDDRDAGGLAVTLWQAVCRGGRMDTVVEKATELGVHRIVPLLTQRAVVKLQGERGEQRREHWQRVVHAACEQCGLNRVPEVTSPTALEQAVRALDQAPQPGAPYRWWLDPRAGQHLGQRAASLRTAPGTIILLVGPEGGFDHREDKLLDGAHFERLSLGPRVLRADTAGLAALAMLHGAVANATNGTSLPAVDESPPPLSEDRAE